MIGGDTPMAKKMLTTIDNPYDPHADYVKWLIWDRENGYDTQEYIARIANVSPEMEDDEIDSLVDQAMTEIIVNDTLGNYILIG